MNRNSAMNWRCAANAGWPTEPGPTGSVTADGPTRRGGEGTTWWRRLTRWVNRNPAAAHLLRAGERYQNRLGGQLAAAIAFYSVLAIVPLLMFSFAALGLTLTVIRPELLDDVRVFLARNLNAGPMQDQLMLMIREYLGNWRGVGVLAIIAALFVGVTWMTNLKAAIRAMIRPDFDTDRRAHPFLLELIINLLMTLVLLALIAITFTLTTVGTQLADQMVLWLRLGSIEVPHYLVRLISLGLSLLGATLLFWLLYRIVPEEKPPTRSLRRGGFGAAVCFVGLQAAASVLGSLFNLGRSTQIFGPIIVAMLFLNVFAQLILFFAAWIATGNQPAIARRHNPADEILRDRTSTVTAVDHWIYADRDRLARIEEANRSSHRRTAHLARAARASADGLEDPKRSQ